MSPWTVSTGVDVIAHRQRKFLMGWRAIPPYKNVWALIGGRIIRGESLKAAVVRDCLKSGLRIAGVQQLGVYPVMLARGLVEGDSLSYACPSDGNQESVVTKRNGNGN